MRVTDWNVVTAAETELLDEVALTFGVFDGVHRGHIALLEMLKKGATGARPVVFTFRENPQSLLRPVTYPGDVLTPRQKLERLEREGVDTVIVADFDESFRRMTGTDFLERLTEALHIEYAAVGPDFHCGRNMDTDARGVARYLTARGIRVDIAGPVYDNGSPVSSTRIRRAVAAGDLQAARALLGGDFVLDLRDVRIDTNHHELLIPRTLLRQVVPLSGTFGGILHGPRGSVEGVVHIDPEHVRVVPIAGDGMEYGNYDIREIEFTGSTGAVSKEGERHAAYERGKS
ncbi:MAG: hypothetical protein ACLFM6_00705 [Spirochaetaceae bacterium]